MYVTIASLESKVLKYILRWVIRSMPVNFKRIFFKKNAFFGFQAGMRVVIEHC